ncbi:SDR family oxidoreductase [Methylobacterium currus]|uniref:SDR family oxidoreductase n=1 Tax=Methylobacterium currus TaxID=2051553 RepID=UPI001E29FA81|nr:SDR family oxidoreductase [Methylobacterium currus]UHC19502.1 SDR family oxidoreductase [Methylobacterium currus]
MTTTDGQRILVTAGAGGAGRVMVRDFAARGDRVLVCDLDGEALARLKGEIPGVLTVPCDAGSAASIAETIEAAQRLLGGVDVLVNNVGISGPTAAAEDVALEEWETALRVNLTSHFLFARGLIPGMKRQGGGAIVTISSGSARTGLPLRLPYVVSKGALLSLTTNLARELGPFGIRVNAILPGPIRGERIARIIREKAAALGVSEADYEESLTRYTSLRTLMDPEDIAAMVLFLASSAGRRITGQLIGVDGNLEWEE